MSDKSHGTLEIACFGWAMATKCGLHLVSLDTSNQQRNIESNKPYIKSSIIQIFVHINFL